MLLINFLRRVNIMAIRSKFSALLISLLLVPTFVQAEKVEDLEFSPWTTGIGAGAMFFEGGEEFNGTFITDLKVGYDISDHVTLETGLGWMPFLDARDWTENDPATWHLDDSQAFRGAFDAMYHFGEPGTIRPHLAATGGVTYFNNNLEDQEHWVPFAGAGAGVSFPINERITARADYRALYTIDRDNIDHLAMVSVLCRLAFGDKSMSGSMASKGEAGAVDMTMDNSDLRTIYFDYDKSLLSASARATLESNAKYLMENPGATIVVEGHCDERGTTEYNLALGQRRAQAAYDYLRSLGVESARMSTVSYGEEQPVDPRSNEAAWAKNRRVVCVER